MSFLFLSLKLAFFTASVVIIAVVVAVFALVVFVAEVVLTDVDFFVDVDEVEDTVVFDASVKVISVLGAAGFVLITISLSSIKCSLCSLISLSYDP